MQANEFDIVSALKCCGIEAANTCAAPFTKQKKMLAYANPDGTLRWLWAAESKQPLFLKFYGIIGFKSKLFAAAMQLLFALRLQTNVLKQEVIVFLSEESEQKYNALLGNEWALFTGTVGKLRKALITVKKENESFFLKIPMTDAAEIIVAKEAENLLLLEQLQLQKVITPIGKRLNTVLQQTDVSRYSTTRSSVWKKVHGQAMNEIFEKTNEQKLLASTSFWQTIEQNFLVLYKATPHPNILLWNKLLQQLEEVKQKMNSAQTLVVSLAHADLTAWNCYCDDDKLYVYDWELAIKDAPPLYDFFHFHIQGNCLLGNQSATIIKAKLHAMLATEAFKAFCEANKIDAEKSLKLYLLYHVSSSLCWYAEQKQLHLQVQWLTKLWADFLTE